MPDQSHVAQSPPTGHTGLIDQPGGGAMTTRTHDTATTSASGPTPGGRGRGPLIAALVVIALVVLAGCVYLATQGTDAPPKTATTSSVDPADAAREAALNASVAQVKALNAWDVQSPLGAVPPPTLATTRYIEEARRLSSLFKQYHRIGQDKLLWVMPGSYSASKMTTTATACGEVHARFVDKSGNNVRTDQQGNPVKDGQHLGVTYTLKSADNGKTWLIDSQQVSPTC